MNAMQTPIWGISTMPISGHKSLLVVKPRCNGDPNHLWSILLSGTYAMELETGRVQYGFRCIWGTFDWVGHPLHSTRSIFVVTCMERAHACNGHPTVMVEDGPPFALLHFSGSVKPFVDRELRIDTSINNLLNSEYKTLIYHVDANALSDDQAKYPNDLEERVNTVHLCDHALLTLE